MAPPVYWDLGKAARDVFKVGYHPGLWQLDCKTLTSSGIEFFTTGFASQDASKVVGSLQSKYKIEDYGIVLTERWNTENWLFGQIMQKDKLSEGLMLLAEGRFQPSSGDKDGKILANYAQDVFNIVGKVTFKPDPILGCSLVLSRNEFLAGVSLDHDLNASKLAWKVALGWTNEKLTLHGELINAEDWLFSLFHKANDQIDVGFEIGKVSPPPANEDDSPRDSALTVGLGMIYHLEGDALIRAKINDKVDIGLGYQQKLRDGITMSISTIIEGKNLSDGNHKFGVGLALEC